MSFSFIKRAPNSAGSSSGTHVMSVMYCWGRKCPCRVAMAIQAPAHAQLLGLVDLLHLVHSAMAGDAADAPGDVGAVIEVDVVGQVVDPLPMDGPPPAALWRTSSSLALSVAIGCMAVHAGGRGRHGGLGGPLDRVVAVAAVDAQLAGVQRVAIGHGLPRLIAHGQRPRRSAVVDDENQIDRRQGQQHARQRSGTVDPWGNKGPRIVENRDFG